MGAKMTVNPLANLNAALEALEQHELAGAKIIIHPSRYEDIERWKRADDPAIREQFSRYMRGYLGQDIK